MDAGVIHGGIPAAAAPVVGRVISSVTSCEVSSLVSSDMITGE